MYSRITFEIVRNNSFPEPALISMIVAPANYNGLRGKLTIVGGHRYTVVLEGQREDVIKYLTYVDYGSLGFGELTCVHTTHHHAALAFQRGVRIVVPE